MMKTGAPGGEDSAFPLRQGRGLLLIFRYHYVTMILQNNLKCPGMTHMIFDSQLFDNSGKAFDYQWFAGMGLNWLITRRSLVQIQAPLPK